MIYIYKGREREREVGQGQRNLLKVDEGREAGRGVDASGMVGKG